MDDGPAPKTLKARLAERFREVNGDHPMSAADDAYATAWYADLEAVARAAGRDPGGVRRMMLDGRLPLPSYLRSDGTEMVPPDLFALAGRAGGVDALHGWFVAQWDDPAAGQEEWAAYLSGQYVCLRTVTPSTIQRKGALVTAITAMTTAAPAGPDAGTPAWARRLHALVDELDALEPPFTAYDRLRFGGPVSREVCIDAVRARHPRTPGDVTAPDLH
ncbi:hypothetical protein ETD83_30940 [Actinomadura soli]|uniref:Uncharacterized protein n=1 Tax=Actinomadura soli TaxID=2508997 RepID=A0A5C4J5E6_9ACTN|nr:DUF6058 family natural product biosynthesis protein [Actinomadura soli]TMQ91425.1 hypothetical protein ETD83_30940 [Actinomadura soli]